MPEMTTVGLRLAVSQLAIIAPHTPSHVLEERLAAVQRALDCCDCNTPARAAAILARMATETEGFQLVSEEESEASGPGYRNYLGRHGNTTLSDCLAYFGRGLLQLTFKDNYAALSAWLLKDLGIAVDFVARPELVNSADYLGLESAFYVATRPALIAAADRGDIDEVSTLVNADSLKADWIRRHGNLLDGATAAALNKALKLGEEKRHGIYGLHETQTNYNAACKAFGLSA